MGKPELAILSKAIFYKGSVYMLFSFIKIGSLKNKDNQTLIIVIFLSLYRDRMTLYKLKNKIYHIRF
ncbi:hypothetical protein BS333_19590 [Vibrio azureus]|uniref:Uncharacterized protein n=1 Tax=Vibrio azureus NBRC 104587 TaxID=1219077 RepID=U3ATG1_9VIBR|nr:hypothetical protein BS333_19590 [Vibrio azureus]GAD77050.1 hypothetical protein VAZ01S_059_00090 [Vibrio azureus NBRC 104587]